MHFFSATGLPYFIVAPIFVAVWWVAGFALKKILFAWIKQLSTKTESKIDDIFVDAAETPASILILIAGIALAFRYFLPVDVHQRFVPLVPAALKVGSILSVVLFVDRLGQGFISTYATRSEALQISKGIIGGLTRGIVFVLGVLIVLETLGVSITPIIASLGIGSLAVALALQPTLENLFAGFQIILDQPLRPGQYVRLESGEEGYVENVGWRSTSIRQLSHNMIIIPNSHLVNSRVINFHRPSKEVGFSVEVGVHYNSDLEKVERVCLEVAESVLKSTSGAVASFKPAVRFTAFSSSSINLVVALRAEEFADQYLLKHEFIKRLSARFARENIVMPYPIIALNTQQESALLIPEK